MPFVTRITVARTSGVATAADRITFLSVVEETIMRTSSKFVTAGFALIVVLAPIVPPAWAGPNEDVALATSRWAQALGEDEPDKVLPLYSEDAVLWGTLSPTVRADRAALRDYFVAAFKALPGLKVTFGEQLIRVYGTTAVNTG